MKQIKLIETSITNSNAPADFKLSYKKEFLRLVEIIPEGATASQMGSLIKVSEKLMKCPEDGTLYLEDAEWETLKGKLESAKFNIVAPEIVAMVEVVKKAEDSEAPHLRSTSPVESKKKAAAGD